MKKTAKKVLSLILCMILCMSLLPVSAFAENEEAAEENLTAAELPESNEELAVKEPAEEPAAEPEETSDGDANVAIDESSFPDAAFREYISANFDSDSDGQLSAEEIANVRSISCDGLGLTSLEGIALFQNLSTLECNNNQLTELDVSQNPKLGVLSCMNNQLAELDVSKNPELISLQCGTNQLTSLDVSQNPKLNWLSCWENQLTELDVSKNPELTSLQCGTNQLTELDVSQNPKLDIFSFWENQLTELDVSKNPELTSLQCGDNQLAELDVSQNPKLNTLSCGKNQLTELDVSKNPELTFLALFENQLTALDVSSNLKLTSLQLSSNQLTALDVSNSPALEVLLCHNNQLTALDLSNNPALISLGCSLNQLTELDLSNNPSLQYLSCSSNQLTALDVSGNPALETLYCIKNQLTVLDVSNNTNLQTFNCSEQSVTVPSFTQSGEKYIFDLSALVGAENTGKISSVENGDYDPETGIASFDAPGSFTYYYSTGYGETLMDVCVSPEDTGEENIVASGTCGENLTWTLDNAGLLTISGTGDMTNYSLCEAPWWENYCDDILSIVIESGVTSIGDCAFQDCRNVKSISIPEGVTRIGDYAIASFDLGNSSLTEIRFPDSLTSIGKQAIYGCNAITEIRLPDGVVSIGGPFTLCAALKAISIPSSTVDIGAYLVMRCPNLTEVLVDEGNTVYTSVDGVLFSKDLKKLICFPAGKAEEYTVPEGVESIGEYAFDFSGVRKVVLPGSVVSIGEYAFNNCSSLSDITLESGITSIGDSAFYSCSSLTEIRFVGDAPAIGTWAFYDVTATAYYPAGNETWTEEVMQNYGGSLTWTSNVPGLPINETNFPDQAFREYVTGFDTDGDGYFSAEELNAVTDISCSSKGIYDLTGIEHFSQLRTLNCEWNYLENADLSANTALEEVSLCANQLLSLNVNGLTALTSLNVGFYGYEFDENDEPILDAPYINKLTALDLSTNTALETLNCDANSLTTLNVSGNKALTSLSCINNKLEQIDLSANTGLLALYISGNPIETLDVSANTQLDYLSCHETLISSLDLHANTALTGLECVGCEKLTGLDLSANTELTTLVTFWSKIERLDVSANTKLETLNCSEGSLEQITGLAGLTNLNTFMCEKSHFTTLDLSCFAGKESFWFSCEGQTSLISAGAALQADGSCRVNIADLVGAENTGKVSGVVALTRSDGETPELISYDETTGIAVFTAAPESIVYDYDVGCNDKKMDVTAPVSLATGYELTGTAVSWDGNGNELICLYSGLTEDEIEADIATGAAGARYTAQCNEAVQNADGERYDVAFRFADVEAGEYILAINKPGNYVLKTVNVTVSGDADLGELTLQLTGDVSGDGNVNTMDLIRLMKYISGVEVDMAEGAGDVNGDGKVNTMDLIRLMKLVNGEIV